MERIRAGVMDAPRALRSQLKSHRSMDKNALGHDYAPLLTHCTLFLCVCVSLSFHVSRRYEPGQQISDQSNYRRKPAEDLRMATKMELTSSPHQQQHHSTGGASVTKPSAPAASGAASGGAYAWKSSGFSQCSASCLGGTRCRTDSESIHALAL